MKMYFYVYVRAVERRCGYVCVSFCIECVRVYVCVRFYVHQCVIDFGLATCMLSMCSYSRLVVSCRVLPLTYCLSSLFGSLLFRCAFWFLLLLFVFVCLRVCFVV